MDFTAAVGFGCPFCDRPVAFPNIRYATDGHIYLTANCACGKMVLVGLTEAVATVMDLARKKNGKGN